MSEETDLALLGVEVQGRGVKETKADLVGLADAGGKAESVTGKLTRATEMLSASLDQVVAALAANTAATNLNSAATNKKAEASQKAASATEIAKAASDALADALMKEAVQSKSATAAAEKEATAKRKNAAATKELDEAQKKATASSKAMTQVSLNMTRQLADVFTTAAMGMNPFMILIQQGPQIADGFQMAASQGLSFKAVLSGLAAQAGPLIAVLAPWIALGGAVAGFAALALKGQEESARLNNILAITGQQASLTSAEFDKMAKNVADSTNYSVGKTRDVMTQFVETGKYSSQTIKLLTEDVITLANYTGKSTDEFVTMFNGMGANVSEFAAKFNQQYKLITLAQYEHIRLLEEEGKTAEAQAYFAKAAHEGMAKVAVEQLGYVERGWRGVTNAISDAIEAVKKFGREKTTDEKRDRVGHLNFLIGNMDNMPKDRQVGWMRDGWVKERDKLWSEVQAATKPDGRADQGAAISASASVNSLLDKVDRTGALERALNKFDENIKTLRKAGGEVPTDKQIAQIKDQIRKDFMPVSYQSPSQLNSARMAGLRQEDGTQDAIAKAEKDRLAAEMSLTANAERLVQYKKDQIDFEAATAKANAERDVGLKKIKASELETITSKIDETARLKKQKVDQDATAQAVREELAAYRDNVSYLDTVAQYTAEQATTQEERNRIERESLQRRQEYEAYALTKNNELKVSTGEISSLSAAASQLQLQNVQFMQGESQARRQIIKAAMDQVAASQASLQSDIALLQSRQALAASDYQAMVIERQISEKRYQIELASLKATTLENGFTAEQVRTAKDSAATLAEIHENELKRLDLSKAFNAALADAIENASSTAKSFIAGDVGGSITGLSKTFKSVSGLFKDQSGALAKAFGSAASFLGPVGTAVSAVTSVLGAIGEKSAAKAQEKLKAIDDSVKKLRDDNMSSSNSINKSIEQASKLFNSDLETSNEMLASLKSIDSQIGNLAVSVSRSITAGDLFDTSSLGLGSSSKGGSLITGLANLLLGGKKTTTSLSDQGLNFGSQTYGSVTQNGISGSTYADLITTTVKKFLGVAYSTKVSTSTVTGSIDGDLLKQISGVIGALGDGVIKAATVFGDEAAKAATTALESAQIDIGKLSFKDLKAEDIEKLLNATFAKVGDDLAKAGVPAIEQFAKVGEGAFETLTRLARGYQVFDTAMKQIGKTFDKTGTASIAARQHLIDLAGSIEDFASQALYFSQNYLTDAEQLAPVQKQVTDTMTKLGLSAVVTKDQFKQVVQGIDITTEYGANLYSQLMKVAPAFDKVATAADAAAKAAVDAAKAELDAANSAVDKAKSDLLEAYNRERDAITGLISKFKTFSDQLKKFKQELSIGTAAGLSPEAQYFAAKNLFETTKAKAATGDEQAMNDLQSVSQAFLDASRDYYASSEGYFKDLEAVKSAVQYAIDYADKQVDLLEKQLKALEDMVSPLIDINKSVLSVKDAVVNLQTAMAAQAAAQQRYNDLLAQQAAQAAAASAAAAQQIADAIKNSKPVTPTNDNSKPTVTTTQTYTWADYLADNPDVSVGYSQVSQGYLKKLGINSVQDYAAWHYANYGKSEGRKGAGEYTVTMPATTSQVNMPTTSGTSSSSSSTVSNADVVQALDTTNTLLKGIIDQNAAVASQTSEENTAIADSIDTLSRRIAS